MKLFKYLTKYFYTEQELVEHSNISLAELVQWQNHRMMPACSYHLALSVTCESFITAHQSSQQLKFYNKGYVKWLELLTADDDCDEHTLFDLFSSRYNQQIITLKQQGFYCNSPKMTNLLAEHINQEWQDFLQGVYGLCTKSGLPEDIASKELAISIISELTAQTALNTEQKDLIKKAINLLDKASAAFAPHEVKLSSREKYINQLRKNI